MRWVTFDQGNSSLKWCLWEAEGDEPARIVNRGAAGDEPLERALREPAAAAPAAALYSGVAAEERALAARAAWEALAPSAPWREPAPVLASRCEEPEAVGRDRRFAALAAFSLKGPSVVVDAGTALTVDAVAEGPTFLGGAIAPGPALLADALDRGGARLFKVTPDPDAGALGRSTEAALVAGVSVGFRGAAAALVDQVSLEAGLADAPLLITGGARALLGGGALFDARRVHAYADLVHLGVLHSEGVRAELEEESWPSISES